ncbi:MAG: sigma-70 family RNA polymerase sigma factor [Acidobacteria bacterium]|nr:sigma-70 family RNA polymerase sigma factor [Acidobacteriota bacterium]
MVVTNSNVTQLLQAWNAGDQAALEKLLPQVQAELHRLAAHYMHQQTPDHLLQATALVNEAWLHLIDWRNVSWQSRAHFFGVAAILMRRILVDEARKQQAQKHGGKAIRVTLGAAEEMAWQQSPELIALDDALKTLAQFDERRSRIVELRFFGGLSVEETAEVLGVSPRTIAREWRLAQAWLYRELNRK